jgi:hypothetical protein
MREMSPPSELNQRLGIIRFGLILIYFTRFESVYLILEQAKYYLPIVRFSKKRSKKKRSHLAAFFVKNSYAAYLRSITLRV